VAFAGVALAGVTFAGAAFAGAAFAGAAFAGVAFAGVAFAAVRFAAVAVDAAFVAALAAVTAVAVAAFARGVLAAAAAVFPAAVRERLAGAFSSVVVRVRRGEGTSGAADGAAARRVTDPSSRRRSWSSGLMHLASGRRHGQAVPGDGRGTCKHVVIDP
jgi:hypothetical protein